jgi:hypothetical protein
VLLAICLADRLAPPCRTHVDARMLDALCLEGDIERLLAQTEATVREVGAFLLRPGMMS